MEWKPIIQALGVDSLLSFTSHCSAFLSLVVSDSDTFRSQLQFALTNASDHRTAQSYLACNEMEHVIERVRASKVSLPIARTLGDHTFAALYSDEPICSLRSELDKCQNPSMGYGLILTRDMPVSTKEVGLHLEILIKHFFSAKSMSKSFQLLMLLLSIPESQLISSFEKEFPDTFDFIQNIFDVNSIRIGISDDKCMDSASKFTATFPIDLSKLNLLFPGIVQYLERIHSITACILNNEKSSKLATWAIDNHDGVCSVTISGTKHGHCLLWRSTSSGALTGESFGFENVDGLVLNLDLSINAQFLGFVIHIPEVHMKVRFTDNIVDGVTSVQQTLEPISIPGIAQAALYALGCSELMALLTSSFLLNISIPKDNTLAVDLQATFPRSSFASWLIARNCNKYADRFLDIFRFYSELARRFLRDVAGGISRAHYQS